MEVKSTNRDVPYRYIYERKGEQHTFEFLSYIPVEPDSASFKVPEICTKLGTEYKNM